MHVLGDAHAPAGDDAAGLAIDLGGGADLRLGQARLLLDERPGFGPQVRQQRLDAGRVLPDEGMVQHAALAVLGLHQVLHHALDHGQVTPTRTWK